MEYCRSADKGFEEGVKIAREIGYNYIEPMVHTGWELLSEVQYFHSFSMEEDPLLLREICNKYGMKISSISGHSPLMKPEAAVSRLTRAIIFANILKAPFVNTDEMVKPEWMDEEFAHQSMKYSLMKASLVAERHKVFICVEPHGIYTKTVEGLMRIVKLVDSPWIAVNWDTGNSYLAGLEDPYEGLDFVKQHVRHIHAKDISMEQGKAERGMVTGTPVGCACGEGVVDWEKVIEIMEPIDREIFLSVECGTIAQAEKSLSFLTKTLGNLLIKDDRVTSSAFV
jgi:sugar phosphate isomerase/epimerase